MAPGKKKINEDFEKRKELIMLKHECNMKELAYIRGTEKLRASNMLSFQRIKRDNYVGGRPRG